MDDGYEAEDDRSTTDRSDCLENAGIFSDPESEWMSQFDSVTHCHSEETKVLTSMPIDCRPESDQS